MFDFVQKLILECCSAYVKTGGIVIYSTCTILKEENELVIKAGRNLFQTNYIDYDDIELANIRVEIKEKYGFAHR